ncbi:cytochrome c [Flavobacterium franklandianum]|uniref:Cytochrome c n=1 Tax=Flavobacterium franklandianum TaxID=2594430 RepID=A0A553CMR9_9FLAO|nr:c-type cytochrome [Flavobacterium franklandianum]TRX21705.1 cytochrome c [Flavobacterium franklandianum]TRX27780.1 cytochrome c [Flavobacterium franklandianum]
MKKIFQYLMMLTVILMATSCYYDEMPPEAEIVIPEVVSYSKDIQPLWDQDCVSCHKTGATAPDLITANSYLALTKNNKYVIPGNAAASSLHKSLVGDGAAIMPTAGKWSDSKIALVDKWINNGALNN